MVSVGCRREEVKQLEEPKKKKSAMAMGSERSRSLHNFPLPSFSWGSRRQLRCVKDSGDGSGSNSSGGGGSDQFPAVDRRSSASSSKSSYHQQQQQQHQHHESTPRFSRKPLPLLVPERKRRSFFDTDIGNGKRSMMSSSRDLYNPPSEKKGKSSSSLYSSTTTTTSTDNNNNGIEAMRKKLVLDLQTEMDKMKFAVLKNNINSKKEPQPQEIKPPAGPVTLTAKIDSAVVNEDARPWNLRTRRAVCKEPNFKNTNDSVGGFKELRIDERKPNSMPPPPTLSTKSSSARRRSDGVGGGEYVVGDKRARPTPMQRAKFSVALMKQEIEEDFVAITGMKPPKRAKKRPRAVQKQVDAVFPGLWLTEITVDMYKVDENPEVRKR